MLRHATGLTPEKQLLQGDQVVENWDNFAVSVARRVGREPMAHITGASAFWDLDLLITRDVLVPRPETETIIEGVLDLLPNRSRKLRILDIGTGSGCLLVTLLRLYPNSLGLGTDRSLAALDCAHANLRANGVHCRGLLAQCNWAEAATHGFNLIVSNPPYLSAADMADLQPELRFEPALALLGGSDGLDAYRQLSKALPQLSFHDARVLVEVGQGQHNAVIDVFGSHGLKSLCAYRDLADIPRVLAFEPIE